MSLFYTVVENTCYMLNRLPGGGIKGRMDQMLTTSTGKEKMPGWVYRKCRVKEVSYQGYPVYILRHPDWKKRSGKAVLFLAGGGGMSRPTALHYDTVVRLVKATGATVYMPFYPLAPKHNVRDALTWLEGIYRGMQKKHFVEEILFAGDSAGANLILSLTARVKQKPCGLLVISPAFGVQDGTARDIRLQMEKTDPILSVRMNDCICENWSKNVPLDSPDISPEFINYQGFPPILAFYGSHELFYPHVKKGMADIRTQGVEVREVVQPMCHDWALCSFFKEGKAAIEQMGAFIKNING